MTSVEIEAKMKIADPAAVVGALKAAGATHRGDHDEINTFFDTVTGSLRSGDQGLRVRVETPTASSANGENSKQRVIITHKGPRSPSQVKNRPETELTVSDDRAAVALLGALGFVRTLGFEKKRSRWELAGCEVDLDTLPHLGHFVEIEGPSESAVLAVRRTLGLDALPLIQTSYIAMLTTHLAEHHLTTKFVGFASE